MFESLVRELIEYGVHSKELTSNDCSVWVPDEGSQSIMHSIIIRHSNPGKRKNSHPFRHANVNKSWLLLPR